MTVMTRPEMLHAPVLCALPDHAVLAQVAMVAPNGWLNGSVVPPRNPPRGTWPNSQLRHACMTKPGACPAAAQAFEMQAKLLTVEVLCLLVNLECCLSTRCLRCLNYRNAQGSRPQNRVRPIQGQQQQQQHATGHQSQPHTPCSRSPTLLDSLYTNSSTTGLQQPQKPATSQRLVLYMFGGSQHEGSPFLLPSRVCTKLTAFTALSSLRTAEVGFFLRMTT